MRIDFNNIYVPDEKLNHVVEESLQKVKKIRRKDRFRRIAGGTVAAAAALAVLTGICASNPVIANNLQSWGKSSVWWRTNSIIRAIIHLLVFPFPEKT